MPRCTGPGPDRAHPAPPASGDDDAVVLDTPAVKVTKDGRTEGRKDECRGSTLPCRATRSPCAPASAPDDGSGAEARSPEYGARVSGGRGHCIVPMARQIEPLAGRPEGWLDEGHGHDVPTAAERAFLELALALYRASGAQGRRELRRELQQRLSAAESSSVRPPAPR